MILHACMLCDYAYDTFVGDPSQNIPAGTPFEDLPEDWTCPKCGAPKAQFYEEEQ